MKNVSNFIYEEEQKIRKQFDMVDSLVYRNSLKVLNAFHKNNLSESHFSTTTGYGYNDIGRDTIDNFLAAHGGAPSTVPEASAEPAAEPAVESAAEPVTVPAIDSAKKDDTTAKPKKAAKEPTPASSLSESLAKIYIKQGRYRRAYEILSDLNLKNPEKSIYFADQLRFLRKVISLLPPEQEGAAKGE